MEGPFCIVFGIFIFKLIHCNWRIKIWNLKFVNEKLKLNLKYELISENFKLILGNWIWFWETWSWYLGSIWNLNHAILLGHGCIMDEFFKIWFLETHTIFENLNLHKLILDFEGNEQQENWRTWIKHYNKEMRSVKMERHNKTLQQGNEKQENWRTQHYNNKMRSGKMEGHKNKLHEGNERQENGRTP
jgi:hypothetical protein